MPFTFPFTYPAINAAGVIAQRPYAETDDFINVSVAMDSGKTFTYSQNSVSLRGVSITYGSISTAEVAVLEAFWDAVGGGLGEFSFTNDHGDVFAKTCFDMPQLDIQYSEPGLCQMVVLLRMQAAS